MKKISLMLITSLIFVVGACDGVGCTECEPECQRPTCEEEQVSNE